MGKSGSKQVTNNNMEKKARTKRTEETEETEEKTQEVRIRLWDIDEEEKLKIAEKMRGWNELVIKGRNRGKTIWEVFANELITEAEEMKSVIIQALKKSGEENDAARIWLDEISYLKPEMEVKEMKEIAHTLKREDVKCILETTIYEKEWEKGWISFKLKHLSRNEKDVIAEKLKTVLMYQAADWVSDWRDFADKMGYTYDKIMVLSEKARPAMKLLKYLSTYHPYTTLKEMEDLCRNRMGSNELAQTISEIRETNLRCNEPYERAKYNGSPDPRENKINDF